MEEKDGIAGPTTAATRPHESGVPSSLHEQHAAAAVSPAMISRVKDYVSAVAARMLFELPEADDAMAETLNGPEAMDALSRFVGDGRVPVLYFETWIPTGESLLLLTFLASDLSLSDI